MDSSTFLARLLGPFFLVMGIGLAVTPENFRLMIEDFLANRGLIFIAGLFAFLPGLAIVLTHNVWKADWRVLITVIGWLGMIGGIFRLLFPTQVRTIGQEMLMHAGTLRGAAIAVIVLGAILSYFGFARR